MEEHDERTFLCGYQNSRGYGSTSCLQSCKRGYYTVIRHRVEPTDTLRGIVLKYNTSMTELKRLNRLWSNESLFLKEFIEVPIYDCSEAMEEDNTCSQNGSHVAKPTDEPTTESVEDIFRRIDLTIKNTSRNVKKFEKNMSLEWQYSGKPTQQKTARHSLNSVPSYQSPL